MKVTTSIFLLVASALASPTPMPSESDAVAQAYACYTPTGLCTKLEQARAAAAGILSAPSTDGATADTVTVHDYFRRALGHTGALAVDAFDKRDAQPGWPPITWCGEVGSGMCMKTRRAAEAVNAILGDYDSLTKRAANADADAQPRWPPITWCGEVGSGMCMKARRSIEHLRAVSDDVIKALPYKNGS
jgi:hypothetical protein